MIDTGWVRIHRGLLKHPLMVQLPAEWFRVWIFILLRANFQPTTWWDGRREVSLPAGSFITSRAKTSFMLQSIRKANSRRTEILSDGGDGGEVGGEQVFNPNGL